MMNTLIGLPRGLLLIVLAHVTSASGSVLPGSYAKVSFGQARENIESYSLQTMSRMASAYYHPFGYLRNGLTALAEWDLQHGTTTFEKQVREGNNHYAHDPGACHGYWNIPLINSFNDFSSWSALGVLEAYEAYGNNSDLQTAEGAFNFVTDHGYIKPADIQAGHLVNTKPKNNTLHQTCNGQSMVGGVYWQNGCPNDGSAADDPKVDAVSTGAYALLGASLCRLTSNQTYCSQAYSSLQWLDNHLRQDDDLISSHVSADDCGVSTALSTYNSALYLAAYATLGNITNNATALSLAENTAIASMTTPHWNSPQGIITQGVGPNLTQASWYISFGPVLVRNLHKAYPFFPSDLQQDILSYLNIQYWAITQLDSNDPMHPMLYGRNWTGPGFVVATNQTMAASLDVLNGLSLNDNSSFPTSEDTTKPVASSAFSLSALTHIPQLLTSLFVVFFVLYI